MKRPQSFNNLRSAFLCRSIFFLVLVLVYAQVVSGQNIVLGNPSNAVADIAVENNYLVFHNGFILSYNRSRNASNWVTWHLSGSDIGPVDRTDAFAADPKLPTEWRINGDTFGSVYDRGHMCPSEDRTDTIENNRETFLMSNMEPQLGKLNRGIWKALEGYVQGLAKNGGMEAYMYAGCYGDKGRIKEVMIPTHCWKIVLLLTEGNNDKRRIKCNTRVISVNMPNETTIVGKWRDYRTTIDALEATTGYDFLSTLSQTKQACLESKIDNL